MANRITVYGRSGERNTKRIERDLSSMALNYNFYDVTKQPALVDKLKGLDTSSDIYPKVEIVCQSNGSVYLSNPDTETLMQTLYAEDVLGVTSFWV